ncbi:hypothetical protein, partial [Klebsiella variicola]|uniref:hypothetical protein n=1 Tax=Klebsiella variicola TaxID=244366 RepID=UPI0027303976
RQSRNQNPTRSATCWNQMPKNSGSKCQDDVIAHVILGVGHAGRHAAAVSFDKMLTRPIMYR